MYFDRRQILECPSKATRIQVLGEGNGRLQTTSFSVYVCYEIEFNLRFDYENNLDVAGV
jgi:hypothetical protein